MGKFYCFLQICLKYLKEIFKKYFKVFGSICYSNKGILLDEILPETFYKLIDIQPNKLMPANLNCKFNASDSKIYLTLDYFFKKEETNKNDKYSLTGMLVLRDHIDGKLES